MELPHATFGPVSPNEVGLDQQQEGQTGQPSMDDPVGLRLGAWANPLGRIKYYIGKIGMDVLRWKDRRVHRTEIGFLKFAVDEMVDSDGDPVPQVALYLTRDTEGSQDGDMQQVAIFTRKGVRFDVPVSAPNLGTNVPTSGMSSGFRSDDGRYVYNVQGDPTPEFPHGRIVQYDTSVTPWKAVAFLRPEKL